jgi:hypothetical protein
MFSGWLIHHLDSFRESHLFFFGSLLLHHKERPNDDIEKLLDITFGIVRGLWSFFELWERLLPSKILQPFKDQNGRTGGEG